MTKKNEDKIKMTGEVIKMHSNSAFEVKIKNSNLIVQAYVSGKMKVNHIRILPGDLVDVEMSGYDLAKGRIVYRHK